MQHIRNSRKGVFFLENKDTPVSVVTDFGETIVDGSLCVDRKNDNLYILKNQVWTLIGLSSEATDNIVEVTYNELVSLYNSNTLNTGSFYKIEYQTIHQIPNTPDINVGSTENLIIFATSESTISDRVWSVEYPEDVIYYNIEDDTAEDFSTSRPGFIYFRRDSKNNNEAWIDFREVLYRRWEISTSLNESWINGTSWSANDVVIYNNDLYKCTKDTPILGSFNNQYFIEIFSDVSSYYYLWDDTSISMSGVTVYADSATYNDYLCFDSSLCRNVHIGRYDNVFNNIVMLENAFGTSNAICNDIKIADNCYNMTIRGSFLTIDSNCNSIYMGSSSGYTKIGINCSRISIGSSVNDFTSSLSSQRIDIGAGVYNSAIKSSNNVDIEQNCYLIHIKDCENVTIKQSTFNVSFNYNDDVHVGKSCYNIWFGIYSNQIRVGDNSYNIDYLAVYSTDIKIGENCYNVTATGSAHVNVELKSGAYDIDFIDSQATNVIVGSKSYNITFDYYPRNVEIGNECYNITINDNIDNCKIGNSCYDITIEDGSDNNIIGNNSYNIDIGISSNDNRIENFCANISIENSSNSNIIHSYSSGLDIGSSCNYNIFGKYNRNNVIPNGSVYNEFVANFSNKTFDVPPSSLKVLVSDDTVVTYTSSFSNIVANMIDTNNDIWYQTIDTLGTITSVMMS
jgi:hypothetical protein